MKISIVTSVRNSVNTIKSNICSINSQTYKNWEHIIVDGASTDGTLEYLQSLGSNYNRKIFSEKDSGPLEGFNKGIKLSKGDVVGFLNADDIYFDSYSLQNMANVFENPEVMGCYGDLVYTDKENLEKILRIWSMGEYSFSKLMRGWTAAHPTFYVRKTVFEKIGYFDPYYYLQSDFEFIVRFFLKHKYRAEYINKPLVKMRTGGISNNSIKNIAIQNLHNYKVLKSHGASVNILYPFIRIISRINQYLKAKLNGKNYGR
ncbi:glycosyltransferase [Pseudomonadota bacterium]|nr:glycosyltransferase [Pseudomonadota bacterium]